MRDTSLNVGMWDCGDGNVRHNAAVEFPAITAKTASYTITATDLALGNAFSNAGASGAITLTLPAPKVGARLWVLKQAQQNLTLAPPSGVDVDGYTSYWRNTAAENNKATLLIGISATKWVAVLSTGTWAGA